MDVNSYRHPYSVSRSSAGIHADRLFRRLNGRHIDMRRCISRLFQNPVPIFGNQRFLSCNRFFGFQLLVAFLGLHFWALVFYSTGSAYSQLIRKKIFKSGSYKHESA